MKKNKIIILIVLLVIVVVLIASFVFFKKDKNSATNNETLNNSAEDLSQNNESTVGKINEDKYFIYEQETYELEYEERNFSKKIRIPFININSKDAKDINNQLKNSFEEAKNSVKSESRTSFSYKNMTYEANVYNDEILSVIINEAVQQVPGDTVNEYTVYNFDIETGKLLSNNEVLQKMEITNLDKIIEANLTKEYNDGKKAMNGNSGIVINIVESYESLDKLLSDIKYDINTAKLYVVSDNALRMNIEMYDSETEERKDTMKELKTNIDTNLNSNISSENVANTAYNTVSNDINNSISNNIDNNI